jgi:hypothetical protein
LAKSVLYERNNARGLFFMKRNIAYIIIVYNILIIYTITSINPVNLPISASSYTLRPASTSNKIKEELSSPVKSSSDGSMADVHETGLPYASPFDTSENSTRAAGGQDYLTLLKTRLLKALRIPDREAEQYSNWILALHNRLQKAVKEYYGDSEQKIRYTITLREWHRCADEFIRLANQALNDSFSTTSALKWAFNKAYRQFANHGEPEELLLRDWRRERPMFRALYGDLQDPASTLGLKRATPIFLRLPKASRNEPSQKRAASLNTQQSA